jgi:serine phosphatase RsbU (regulator of sigma subunit)
LSAVQDYLDGRSTEYEVEHRLRHKDGTYRWIVARGAALFDEQGKPMRMAGSHIDITSKKATEESLKLNEASMLAAQSIQEHLLPETPPQMPGFDIAGATFAADFTAGDHYDFLAMPGGRLGLVVGDVSGHGFGPSVFMASVHARIRALAEMDLQVDEILRRANEAMLRESDPSLFVTAFFGCLNPVDRTLEYASAGHPSAYVLDASGEIRHELASTAMPLAVMEDAEFAMGTPATLYPHDILLVLTDGAAEAMNEADEPFGNQRVLQAVRDNAHRSSQEIVQALHRAVCEYAGHKVEDDVTAIIVKVADA